MDPRELVTNILNSPQLRRALEETVRVVTQTAAATASNGASSSSRSTANRLFPSASSSSTTADAGTRVRHELNRLFPSVRPASASSSQSSRRRRRQSSTTIPMDASFHLKEVILLTSPSTGDITPTLRGATKAEAYEEGRALSGVKMFTSWTQSDVVAHIRKIFPTLGQTDFKIRIPIGGSVVDINMEEGAVLDGASIRRLFMQKTLYVCPIIPLEPRTEDGRNDSPEVEEVLPPLSDVVEDDVNVDVVPESFSDGTLAEILSAFRLENLVEDDVTLVNVYRGDIWGCCRRAFQRPSFDPLKQPSILFTDIVEITEGAIDAGGPRREFFRLVLSEIKEKICEGPENAKGLWYNADFVAEGTYRMAGVLMAMSLVHGGPSPCFFTKSFFSSFCSQDTTSEPLGLALAQLITGFKQVRLYDVIVLHKKAFEDAFCYEEKALTASDIKRIFAVNFHPEGSNMRNVESRAWCFFLDFLLECEEKTVDCTMEEIMIFTTGAEREPALGFPEKEHPSIGFLHDEGPLPKANTCGLTLYLPTVHTTYENFQKFMLLGLKEGLVFGFE